MIKLLFSRYSTNDQDLTVREVVAAEVDDVSSYDQMEQLREKLDKLTRILGTVIDKLPVEAQLEIIEASTHNWKAYIEQEQS